MGQPEITQRDLRQRSKEIMDAVEVRPNSEQDDYDEHVERARRLDVLQRAEHEFDPIPSV